MSTMVERVAQAICANHGFYSWEPDFSETAERRGDMNRDDYRRMARAAIAAMREPTQAMLAAEVLAWNIAQKDRPPQVKVALAGEACWQAMIDAALEDAE